MTAREALRKARATMECGDTGTCTCGAWDDEDWRNDLDLPHYSGSSALLDGFTVAEITEAGG